MSGNEKHFRVILTQYYTVCSTVGLAQWAQITKTVHTARLGREFVVMFFWVARFIFMFMYVLVSGVISLHVLALA